MADEATAAFAQGRQDSAAGPESHGGRRVRIAESLKPKLNETIVLPVSVVKAEADSSRYLRWKMVKEYSAEEVKTKWFKKGESFIVDFGEHRVGYVSFKAVGVGDQFDAPTHLRLTFGEVPGDVAESFEGYKAWISSSWLPVETIHIDELPSRMELPRRYAFRYMKVEVLDTSSRYAFRMEDLTLKAVSSAKKSVAPLKSGSELLRRIDETSLATLRDCMQTVFEDGPRRDRRLWIGDLRLQAMTNYLSFQNNDLVKRCLYLFAAFQREDGWMPACVFEKPKPVTGHDYLLDYSVLYGAVLYDYVVATKDLATGRDLLPVAAKQIELALKLVGDDGLYAAAPIKGAKLGAPEPFIDWHFQLDKSAAMQGVLIYGMRRLARLAEMIGRNAETPTYAVSIEKMRAAARKKYFDESRRVFVCDTQVSWASQAWMTLAGVGSPEECRAAISQTMTIGEAVRPNTPYLHHYMLEAMVTCGMQQEALRLIEEYWGGMVKAGADTFWEAYDPKNSLFSPYGDIHSNSFCHAWSCTPAYFLRTMKI
jgi:hypothetical protein